MKLTLKRKCGIPGVTPPRRKGDPLPEGHTHGKPSSYRDEYAPALIKYFSKPASWKIHITTKTGAAQAVPVDSLPTFERFSADLGVHVSTLILWADTHPEFKQAYGIAKSLQKAFLMELGAAGVGNHITSLMLRTNHGMREPKDETPANDVASQLAELIGKMPS